MKMATSDIMIDNKRTRVTRWTFEIGEDTGQHIHDYDYVVVPMEDGQLKIVNEDGTVSISDLTKGKSYYKDKGANHNVMNNNDFPFSFVEIEFK
jgi:beta-alanine degradation protein BauB